MGNPLRALTGDGLRRRTSMKWRRHPTDVLPAWVAEMDVPLAEPIVRAVGEAMALGDTGYPDEKPIYAEALAGFAERRWGWRLPVERTRLVPDVMLGVVEVLKLITGPGAAVVVNSPVYAPFYQFIEHMDRRVIEAPLGPDHRIDPDALDAALRTAAAASAGDGGTAAYLLCSPHNPTGTVHTRDELITAIELAERHRVRIVVDEIHAPLVYPGAVHVPFLTLPGAETAFSLMSASKAWNLAGLKAAVAIAGEAAAADLARMPEEVGHGASHIGVIAHAAALREGGEWLEEALGGLDENRRLLGKLLAERLPEVAYRPPEGTYLAWLDCRALGLGGDPAEVFLERGRVAVNSGPSFGTGGAGHVRVNIATPPDLLAEAVRRMAAALAR